MAEAVASAHGRNAVSRFEILGRADLFHDLEMAADADDFEIRIERLDALDEAFQIHLFVYLKTQIRSSGLKRAGQLLELLAFGAEIAAFAQLYANHEAVAS